MYTHNTLRHINAKSPKTRTHTNAHTRVHSHVHTRKSVSVSVGWYLYFNGKRQQILDGNGKNGFWPFSNSWSWEQRNEWKSYYRFERCWRFVLRYIIWSSFLWWFFSLFVLHLYFISFHSLSCLLFSTFFVMISLPLTRQGGAAHKAAMKAMVCIHPREQGN